MGFEIIGTKYVQKSHFLRNFCKFSESEAFFSRLQNRGGQNLAGCGKFLTACSFYSTADARSDSENLQKFLKKWLFLTYLVPIISKPI